MQPVHDLPSILNRTKGTLLHDRPREARGRWRQALGLMFSIPREEALIMRFSRPRWDIVHMFFVFAPLDILVLDGEGEVVALHERLGPWRAWNPGVDISALVELPAGTIAKSGTGLGDEIVLPRDHA